MPSVSIFLLQGTGRLQFGPHPERARADAELLLMHLLRTGRAWLMAHPEIDLGPDQWDLYNAMLERRYKGEPIQHITGEQEFYGLPFRVTPDVLIPRPETEHLVEAAIEIAERQSLLHIVDVGTGSGAIAVALAHLLPECDVTAIDLSQAALAVARENAARNRVKVRFLEGDLLEPATGLPISLIVSNPPYVAEADRASLSVEVREHEPELALFAGEDGLAIYRRLIPQSYEALSWGGHILLEIGYGQADPVRKLLEHSGFINLRFIQDLHGIPRVIDATRPAD